MELDMLLLGGLLLDQGLFDQKTNDGNIGVLPSLSGWIVAIIEMVHKSLEVIV